jgi:SAM-dependent methyltransferase
LKCSREYGVRDGILDMMDKTIDVAQEAKQEIIARDEDAWTYDGFTDQDWYRLEIPSTMEYLSNLYEKVAVEFGCGTGRFTTEIVSRAKSLLAIDFSRDSLLVLCGKIPERKCLGLIQGDVTNIKLQKDEFEIAISTQVLEHIPSHNLRLNFLNMVRDSLALGGTFLCTAYYQDMRRRLKFQPREGFHESGVFFHYFNRKELQRDFSKGFVISELHPFLFHVPLIWRLELNRRWLTSFFQKTPFLKEFGSLVLVKCFKYA